MEFEQYVANQFKSLIDILEIMHKELTKINKRLKKIK